ncbi:MRC1-like domain-containing protein [Dipodascopsis tothii]|uniref:MRC1-like domain-containing protein n=1 Tax=Dipodascopsis tothii TaxID=44089 RepID=UPI0034CD877D
MHRESERIARNLQLSVEAKTVANKTKESLFKLFNFKVSHGSGSSSSKGESEEDKTETPPSSPIPAAIGDKHPAGTAHPKIRQSSRYSHLLQQAEQDLDDSESELEIVTLKPIDRDRLALRKLKAHIKTQSTPEIDLKKGQMTAQMLHAHILEQTRQQAIKEKQAREADIVAAGGKVITAEERDKENAIIESLLEKERRNAELVRRQEKRERLRNGADESIDVLDMDDRDEEYDTEYTDNESLQEDLEGSSEDENTGEDSTAEIDLEGLQHANIDHDNASSEQQGQGARIRVSSSADIDVSKATSETSTSQLVAEVQCLQVPATQDKLEPEGLSQFFSASVNSPLNTQSRLSKLRSVDDEPLEISTPSKDCALQVEATQQSQPLNTQASPTPGYEEQRYVDDPATPFSEISAISSPSTANTLKFTQATPSSRFMGRCDIPTQVDNFSPLKDMVQAASRNQHMLNKSTGRQRRRINDIETESDDDVETTPKAVQRNLKISGGRHRIKPVHVREISSAAKEMFDDQAEESEDEWAGIGGMSEDDSDGQSDGDTKLEGLVDDNDNAPLREADVAALHAEGERERDEKLVTRLLHDVTTGGFRKRTRRGVTSAETNGLDDILFSDEDDDYEHERHQARSHELAKRREKLLENQKLSKLAQNPKAQPFFQTIEAIDKDRDFFASTDADDFSEVESMRDKGEENSDEVHGGLQAVASKESDNVVSYRRNKRYTNAQRTQTIDDIRKTLSFLTEDPEESQKLNNSAQC